MTKSRQTPHATNGLRVAVALMGILLSVSAVAAKVIEVHIKTLAFSPANFIAHVGDTIEWINGDFVAHTATARNGDWDVSLPANATRRLVIKREGTVEYYCRFHPNMTGEIKISSSATR